MLGSEIQTVKTAAKGHQEQDNDFFFKIYDWQSQNPEQEELVIFCHTSQWGSNIDNPIFEVLRK